MTVREFLAEARRHVRAFFTNWRGSEAPFVTKVAITVKNRTRATFSRAQCCGHPGQPGC